MPANLTNPRPDIVYLRRRLKRGESAQATVTPSTASSSSSSLNLNRDKTSDNVFQKKKEVVASSIPEANGVEILRNVNDAFRLNKRQSAIGSLVISNAMVAAWQLQNGSSGYLYNKSVTPTESPETKPGSFKKRDLIEFHQEGLVVGLRNFKHLKRLIVVPMAGETLRAVTMGGTGVTMDYEPFTVLYLSVVGSAVEFRKEDFRGTITDTFDLHTVKFQ